MITMTGHLIEAVDGVSLAGTGEGAEGADVKSMPMSATQRQLGCLTHVATTRPTASRPSWPCGSVAVRACYRTARLGGFSEQMALMRGSGGGQQQVLSA